VTGIFRIECSFVSGAFETVARPAFDGVDYPPNLMFNQTKWNDASHQKN
jgi:hypothetical protein